MSASAGSRALARRYARGLADAAPKELSRVAEAMDGWKETVRHRPNLPILISDPRLPRPGRAELAQELLSKLQAPRVLVNLVALLIEENRFGLIDSIHSEFMREREKREGIRGIVIETPATLPDHLRERVRSRMAELLRCHVRVEEHLRPGILGGINLRIGSRVWYGNARHHIEQIFRH